MTNARQLLARWILCPLIICPFFCYTVYRWYMDGRSQNVLHVTHELNFDIFCDHRSERQSSFSPTLSAWHKTFCLNCVLHVWFEKYLGRTCVSASWLTTPMYMYNDQPNFCKSIYFVLTNIKCGSSAIGLWWLLLSWRNVKHGTMYMTSKA